MSVCTDSGVFMPIVLYFYIFLMQNAYRVTYCLTPVGKYTCEIFFHCEIRSVEV